MLYIPPSGSKRCIPIHNFQTPREEDEFWRMPCTHLTMFLVTPSVGSYLLVTPRGLVEVWWMLYHMTPWYHFLLGSRKKSMALQHNSRNSRKGKKMPRGLHWAEIRKRKLSERHVEYCALETQEQITNDWCDMNISSMGLKVLFSLILSMWNMLSLNECHCIDSIFNLPPGSIQIDIFSGWLLFHCLNLICAFPILYCFFKKLWQMNDKKHFNILLDQTHLFPRIFLIL